MLLGNFGIFDFVRIRELSPCVRRGDNFYVSSAFGHEDIIYYADVIAIQVVGLCLICQNDWVQLQFLNKQVRIAFSNIDMTTNLLSAIISQNPFQFGLL